MVQSSHIVGGGGQRRFRDAYWTPPYAIEELLKRETFNGVVWEPCAGNKAIARYFPNCIATDIETGDNFLRTWKNVDHIVTNPPFSLAQEFAEHALEVASSKVALLLRLAFLEGQRRYKFFQEHPPRTVYVFSRRLQFNGQSQTGGGSTIAYAWFVWEHGHTGSPVIQWIG